MNESDHVCRRPLPVSPLAPRGAATIVAVVGLALLAAACGGSNKIANVRSSSGGSSSAASLEPLKSEYSRFAGCMRSHRVSDFPDPVIGSGGHPGFRLQGGSGSDLSPNNPGFQRAVEVCQRILGHRFRPAFAPSGVGKGA